MCGTCSSARRSFRGAGRGPSHIVSHVGELPDPDDQFHAAGGGSQHTGVDDGFVIKASAATGKAAWIKHYPQSDRDAQVVGVDMDASGNVFGSGYSCSSTVEASGAPQPAIPVPVLLGVAGAAGSLGGALCTLEERPCRPVPYGAGCG